MDWTIVAASAIGALCVGRMCYHAHRAGYQDGLEQGATYVLRDICEGRIVVKDGKILFDDDCMFGFYNGETKKKLREMEVNDVHFEEWYK